MDAPILISLVRLFVLLFLGASHLLVYLSKGLVSCETLFSE